MHNDKFQHKRRRYLNDNLRMTGSARYSIRNGFFDDQRTKDYVLSITSLINNKTITVDFHQGLGHQHRPSKEAVIYALLMDAYSFDSARDVNDFAETFGITKLSEAQRTYTMCFKSKEKLESLGMNIERLKELFQDF